MLKPSEVGSTILQAGRYLVAAASPVSSVRLGFCTTHVFLNRQGLAILEHDGWTEAAALLTPLQRELDAGVCWADSGKGCTNHYYNPTTYGGLWRWASSAQLVQRFFARALALWARGRYQRAAFFLGAAGHLVQDACEPHHARCKVFDGHGEYEIWVKKYKERYAIEEGGLYGLASRPEEWVSINAGCGYEVFPLVRRHALERQYHLATQHLLGLAQRTTAGFWLFFLQQAGAVPGADQVEVTAELPALDLRLPAAVPGA